jgi:hypothetical protein
MTMNELTSPGNYVEIDGDLYPTERVDPAGRPLPITEDQARSIQTILMEEYESNPAFREVVNARVRRLAGLETKGEAA